MLGNSLGDSVHYKNEKNGDKTTEKTKEQQSTQCTYRRPGVIGPFFLGNSPYALYNTSDNPKVPKLLKYSTYTSVSLVNDFQKITTR